MYAYQSCGSVRDVCRYSTPSRSNSRRVARRTGGPNRGFTAHTGQFAYAPPNRRKLSIMRTTWVSSGPDSMQVTKVIGGLMDG